MTKTATSCLKDLDITDATVFDDCDNTDEEFKVIKKIWRRKVLAEHPDKGGDPALFRTTNASFEVLRDLFQQSSVENGTYTSYLTGQAKAKAAETDIDIDELFKKYSKNTNVPSWDFYAEAEKEEVPIYKVENARSARSACAKCKSVNQRAAKAIADSAAAAEDVTAIVAAAPSRSRGKKTSNNAIVQKEDTTKITKGQIRVGSIIEDAGTYGRWHHLQCWRVPKKIQAGLTNLSDEEASLRDLLSMEEVLLTGLGDMDEDDQMTFVRHCINADNHAGKGGRKRKAAGDAGQGKAKTAKVASKFTSTSKAAKGGNSNIVPGSFKILVPGVDGAVDDESFLKGKTFVMTGVFPEVGGGDDDCLGVENLKSMIETFGGKVITRFSKNTNFLLTGQNPVAKRFKDARAKSIEVVNLVRLSGLLKGQLTFDRLDKLDALGSEEFMGDAYQQATNAKMVFGDTKPSAVGKKEDAKKPAAVKKEDSVNVDEIPPLESDSDPNPMEDDSKPAAVSSSGAAAAATSQAIVLSAGPSNESTSTTAIVPASGKTKFMMPKPGKNGAIADCFDGQTFVLTGLFPELGGGSGLNYGKDKMKTMLQNFGGRVTGSISGKTNFLVVGKDPGASKVSKASAREIPLVDLLALNRVIHGQATLDDISSEPAPQITNFSAGFKGNALIKNAAEW